MHRTRKKQPQRREMKLAPRMKLIRTVYNTVLDETESFAPDQIGEELAYLLGAIADATGGDYVQLSADSALWRILCRCFPDVTHPVWLWVFPEPEPLPASAA